MAKILRYENVKHVLTDSEKSEIGTRIAREVEHVRQLEETKKSVVSQYNSEIALAKQNISKDSGVLTNGYEFRSLECEIRMNDPKNGVKKIIPLNKLEKSFTVPMLPTEMQEEAFDKDERNRKKKEDASSKAPVVPPPTTGDAPPAAESQGSAKATKKEKKNKKDKYPYPMLVVTSEYRTLRPTAVPFRRVR